MIRALIVDDESPARTRMHRLLEATSCVHVLGQATNGIEALEKIDELSPDVLFLDIEMPELDGIAVAQSLGTNGPLIVFVTAYDEFAIKAFETHAIDYLLKPVANDRLNKCIQKIQLHLQQKKSTLPTLKLHSDSHQDLSLKDPHVLPTDLTQNLSKLLLDLSKSRMTSRFAIRSGNKYSVVDLNRVTAILAKDHYSAIQVDGKEYLSDDTLDIFEGKLDPTKYFRVHRSAIVNMDFVESLEREGDRKFVAVLSDSLKSRIPISRERLDDVKKWLNIL